MALLTGKFGKPRTVADILSRMKSIRKFALLQGYRHDIFNKILELLKDHLPGQKGKRGWQTSDNRQLINAVIWILRTGAPWRDLPPDYGGCKNTHRRFCRWRDKGIWEKLYPRS